VQKYLVLFSSTHQETPQITTQLKVVNVHYDDNHEPVQPFDEVVSVQQPWQSPTPSYNIFRIDAFTLITTSPSFQNQPSHTNIHLVPINSKMEQFHLLNRLELCHVDQKPFNQLVSIPHVELVERKTTPTIV
jgi:hypothetical protein